MIYLDSAATTLKKPKQVIDAVITAMSTLGNASRGVHSGAMTASRTVYDTRIKLATLFGCKRADHVVFTSNSTEVLNIYAAPMSLCVAGYVQSVSPKSLEFLLAMYTVACILYIFSFIKVIGYLKLPFYPSYAAFTFPFVISAIASKQTMACAGKLGCSLPFLNVVVLIETVIATVLVLYTLVRFILFLTKRVQPIKK